MDPVTIIMVAGTLLLQLVSLGLGTVKLIKRSTCCGGEVEFRSSESVRNLEK